MSFISLDFKPRLLRVLLQLVPVPALVHYQIQFAPVVSFIFNFLILLLRIFQSVCRALNYERVVPGSDIDPEEREATM